MKNTKRFSALLMSFVMLMSCFATLTLGVLATDPNETSAELMYEYNFGQYSDDISTAFNAQRNINVSVSKEAHSGYASLTSNGGDHYVVFSQVPDVPTSQLDHIVIKYRATASAQGDLFVARDDNVGWGAAGSNVKLDFVGDGQWHVLYVDASQVWGNVDGVLMTDVRFDPLNEAAGQFDLAYIKFFATHEGATAQMASETVTTHVSGELPADSDQVFYLNGSYYTADVILPLTTIEGGPVDAVFEGDPAKLSICCDAIFTKKTGEEEVTIVEQVANVYLRDEMGGQIIDTDGTMEYFSLYCWVNPLDDTIAMAAFGYQINDMDPVFNTDWVYNDVELQGIIGPHARRAKYIQIDTSELPSGTFNVYPLMKTAEGVIYHLATWGSMQFVKGGDIVGSYKDANNNSYSLRGNYLFQNGKDAGLSLIVDDNGKAFAYAHTIPLSQADGKFVYDMDLSYVKTPIVPVKPPEPDPVYYTATFTADDKVVAEIKFLENTTEIEAPTVPEKEGYSGEWETYTVTNADFTVKAIYTPIEKPAEKLVITDPSIIDRFSESQYNAIITANQSNITYNDDGSVTFTGTWEEGDALDPFFTLKYANLMRKAWKDFTRPNQVPNANGEYTVLVFKVKIDASVAGNAMLYYSNQGGVIDGTLTEYPVIDATGTGDIEYIVFDMAYTDFATLPLSEIRLDWVESTINQLAPSEENTGASMTLYEIRMFKDMTEAAAACGFAYEEETKKPAAENTQAENETTETPEIGDETQDTTNDNGCGSVVGLSAVATLMSAIAAAYVLRRRQD